MKLLRKISTFFALCLFAFNANGQANIEFKLQLEAPLTWGVYAKPVGVSPSQTGIMSTGQVTIVMPNGYEWHSQENFAGNWTMNAPAYGPDELPDRQILPFGYDSNPLLPVELAAGQETLLFTFKGNECPDTLYLIDCITALANGPQSDVCPYCPEYDDGDYPDNSLETNPGNNFAYFDLGNGVLYDYQGNYAPSAWSCHDCDGDGIPNGIEDTNGNGVYDVGVDSTDMCDPCDPYRIISATLKNASGFDVICAGDIGDTAYLVVDIEVHTGQDTTKYTGFGWSPYMVVYTEDGGVSTDTIFNYHSGDTIAVAPTGTEVYTLVTVLDSFNCTSADSLFGAPLIEVHGPIYFSEQPQDYTECSEDGAQFSVMAENAGDGTIAYNWQISMDDGATYYNLDNTQPFTTVFTNALLIDEVAGLNGTWYRCAISTEVCDTVYSDWAELTVDGPITVISSPADLTVCDGGSATFSGGGNNYGVPGTLYYQWQNSTDGGATWTDISGGIYSNEQTTTLTITQVDVSMDGFQYRMSIFTPTCSRIYTESATLNVEGPLLFVSHPQDFVTSCGGEAFFDFEYQNPGGGNVYYQWQQSLDGGTTWTNLVELPPYNNTNGVNSAFQSRDTFVIAGVVGLAGALYRVQLSTPTCSGVTSNIAQVIYDGDLEIIMNPMDATGCGLGEAEFFGQAEISQPGSTANIQYEWQMSEDGGLSWFDLSNGSNGTNTITGTNTDNLHISPLTGLNESMVRMRAHVPSCASVFSTPATIHVEGSLVFNQEPDDATVCSGEPVCFSVEAVNTDTGTMASPIVYQWQILWPGSVNWENLPNSPSIDNVNTYQLCISDATGLHDSQFRVLIQAANCSSIASEPALLTVGEPYFFSQHPIDVHACAGEPVQFEVEVENLGMGNLIYEWEVSANGVIWSDINGFGGIYSGANTNVLSISDVSGLYNYKFRCKIKAANCGWEYSQLAQLFVEGPIWQDQQPPSDITICDNSYFTIESHLSLPASSSGFINYQWQANDGSGWINIANDETTGGGYSYYNGVLGTETGEYSGVNTSNLDISLAIGLQGYQYRCIAWTLNCGADTSDVVTIHTLDACEDETCDFDLDGTPNSDDFASPCFYSGDVKVKLEYDILEDEWEIFAAPTQGFSPVGLSELLSGRLTIAASPDFVPGNIISYAGGDWEPGAVLIDAPENPGMNYFTFELEPDGVPFDLEHGHQVKLFKFKNTLGVCPDSLYIMDGMKPNLIEENTVTGMSDMGTYNEDFLLAGTYGKAWECGLLPNGGFGTALDSLTNGGGSGSALFAAGGNSDEMTIAPNPASDYLDIKISMENTDNQSLVRLVNLHGQTLQTHLADGQNTLRLELGHLPAGLYFLSLERDGKVVEREKFMKE